MFFILIFSHCLLAQDFSYIYRHPPTEGLSKTLAKIDRYNERLDWASNMRYSKSANTWGGIAFVPLSIPMFFFNPFFSDASNYKNKEIEAFKEAKAIATELKISDVLSLKNQ